MIQIMLGSKDLPFKEFDILPRIVRYKDNDSIGVGFAWGYWGILFYVNR